MSRHHIHVGSVDGRIEPIYLGEISSDSIGKLMVPENLPATGLDGEDRALLVGEPGEFLKQMRMGEGKLWGLHTKLDAASPYQLAGAVSLLDMEPGREPEVATFILDPAARGKGAGTLAKQGMLAYAFEQGKGSVLARTAEDNPGAIRSSEKAGFVRILSPRIGRVSLMAFNPEGPEYRAKDLKQWGITHEQVDAARRKYQEAAEHVRIQHR